MASDAKIGDAEFDAQMRVLHAQYVAGLPARRMALAQALQAYQAEPDGAARQALRDVAHRLSGSAASYGFGAVGDCARALDRLLSGHVPCHDAARITAGAGKLLGELDRAISTA